MARHDFGWLGWFSLAGVLSLGPLLLVDVYVADVWPYSQYWTFLVLVLSAIGTVALYYGNDPSDGLSRESTT
ncbi:hypothetical protein G9C85_07505 [Halorubellus sp. JP-L1]|uniref:hypothetical protein n=1 Tax=Halorubellus sp. JP-L1 TaxID=2715753 RepID=UPI00140E6545|nr:hypothetical protein [Halorubellus sp. JP-L1]NHN41484.1 hypothetical protein [Halorubellus sp. JP-L1]